MRWPRWHNLSEQKIQMKKNHDFSLQQASATVEVTVSDDNDNDPVFLLPSYVFSIPENLSPDFHVGAVKVTMGFWITKQKPLFLRIC